MTIKTSPLSGISIQNTSGVDMFNSNDKLLYRKNYYSGSISLGPSVMTVAIPMQSAVSDANTLFIIQSKITYCNGNFGSAFVGSVVDLSSSILTNFGYATTYVEITQSDYLSAAVQRVSSASDLQALFSYVSIGKTGQYPGESLRVATSTSSINLDYYISVFGWN